MLCLPPASQSNRVSVSVSDTHPLLILDWLSLNHQAWWWWGRQMSSRERSIYGLPKDRHEMMKREIHCEREVLAPESSSWLLPWNFTWDLSRDTTRVSLVFLFQRNHKQSLLDTCSGRLLLLICHDEEQALYQISIFILHVKKSCADRRLDILIISEIIVHLMTLIKTNNCYCNSLLIHLCIDFLLLVIQERLPWFNS